MFVLQSNDDVLKIWASINFTSVLRQGIGQVCTGCIPRCSRRRHTKRDLVGVNDSFHLRRLCTLWQGLKECKQVFSLCKSGLLSKDCYGKDLPCWQVFVSWQKRAQSENTLWRREIWFDVRLSSISPSLFLNFQPWNNFSILFPPWFSLTCLLPLLDIERINNVTVQKENSSSHLLQLPALRFQALRESDRCLVHRRQERWLSVSAI